MKGKKIYTLAYANSMVLIAEEEDEIRAIITRFERYIREKRLIINVRKSQIIRFGKRGGAR